MGGHQATCPSSVTVLLPLTGHASTSLLRVSSPLAEALQASRWWWLVVLITIKPTEVQTALRWPRWADRLGPVPPQPSRSPWATPLLVCFRDSPASL